MRRYFRGTIVKRKQKLSVYPPVYTFGVNLHVNMATLQFHVTIKINIVTLTNVACRHNFVFGFNVFVLRNTLNDVQFSYH